MEQLIIIIQKRDDLDASTFRDRWTGEHAQVVRSLPGLRRYYQDPVIDTAQRAPHAREADEIDAFAQLWFDDRAAIDEALASEVFARGVEILRQIDKYATFFT